jgi:FMN phosphatase YigB (HAD superfamily)
MKILVDVDDTLYDSSALMSSCFRQLFELEVSREQIGSSWGFYHDLGVDADGFARLVRECYHAPGAIAANVPYRGAAATLRAWARRGHEIHVVSDRGEEVAEATRGWLERHRMPAHRTVFARGVDKLAYVRREGIELAIDDRPSLLEALVADGSAIAATIAQPVNAAVRERYGEAIVSAPDWPALRRALRARAGV